MAYAEESLQLAESLGLRVPDQALIRAGSKAGSLDRLRGHGTPPELQLLGRAATL
ncbi:MAG: hypothetical protein HY815_21890 [Candidatus Riflebacteria bacterium]|nr:hypothetical protein [Candidatus Riflebacteria bacterium]